MRAECTALEVRLKGMIDAVEERERKLVRAEESLAKRKSDLEREYTNKVSEAEAAVRRLQVRYGYGLFLTWWGIQGISCKTKRKQTLPGTLLCTLD